MPPIPRALGIGHPAALPCLPCPKPQGPQFLPSEWPANAKPRLRSFGIKDTLLARKECGSCGG